MTSIGLAMTEQERIEKLLQLRCLVVEWRQDAARQLPPVGRSLDQAEALILDLLGQ